MGKRRQRPAADPYACARVYSAPGCIQCNTRPSQRGATALMLSAPSSKRQHQSRPDQHPAGHHSAGHPSQEDSQNQGEGEESPGAACSAGRDGDRRRLPLRHPASGRRSEQAEGPKTPEKWRFARELAGGGASRCFNDPLMQRHGAGMTGNLARRGSGGGSVARGRGWFAIPRAEIERTPWVTLLPPPMFRNPTLNTTYWNQVPS